MSLARQSFAKLTKREGIAEVQTAEGKTYLFLGIDRTRKFAVTAPR
jgi:hypothetical protein